MNAELESAGEDAGGQQGTRAAVGPLAGLWWLVVLNGLVWLVVAAIMLRFASATATMVILGAVVLLSASDEFLARTRRTLPPLRKLTGHTLAATLALLLAVLVTWRGGQVSPAACALALVLAVTAIAFVGGAIPGVIEAVTGSLLLGVLAAPRPGQPALGGVDDAAVLGVLVAVAAVVGLLAEDAARRRRQAVLATEEAQTIMAADRIRAALLTTVSHDLRSPLASAKAAVSCLRTPGLQLTVADHDELLATADESLDQLAHLAAGLLDASRLQAGSLPMFPRSADLGEIIVSSLGELGPPAQTVLVEVPRGLPEVMADPAMTERIIVNLVGNALRYAPAGSLLRLTARALGDRVELRVIDRGPGIPQDRKDQAFLPFCQLGRVGQSAGVGLGLAVSRGLAEAMGGTLQPEDTPGGGLTMALSLPAAALRETRRPQILHQQHGRGRAQIEFRADKADVVGADQAADLGVDLDEAGEAVEFVELGGDVAGGVFSDEDGVEDPHYLLDIQRVP